MTEAQGWMALLLGIVSLLVIVWRLGSGFGGIRKDICWMQRTNQRDHEAITKRLDHHSEHIKEARDRIAGMEGTFEILECVRHQDTG